MKNVKRVSVHGGHSGEFCLHAKDSLEEIVKTYIAQRFAWVGITEHAPPLSDKWRYAEEREAGLTADALYERYGRFIEECRRLQKKYASEITLYVGTEIETYEGYKEFVPKLLSTFAPDFIVGSIHYMDGIGFDCSRQDYRAAVANAGSTEALYCNYFDLQYEMISLFKPAVVGHFDVIRIFDDKYMDRLLVPEIAHRIERNLALIQQHDLILDCNLRALLKGAEEPYPSATILQRASELGISAVPGDDSHGCDSVGAHMEEGIALLERYGFNTNWKLPTA